MLAEAVHEREPQGHDVVAAQERVDDRAPERCVADELRRAHALVLRHASDGIPLQISESDALDAHGHAGHPRGSGGELLYRKSVNWTQCPGRVHSVPRIRLLKLVQTSSLGAKSPQTAGVLHAAIRSTSSEVLAIADAVCVSCYDSSNPVEADGSGGTGKGSASRDLDDETKGRRSIDWPADRRKQI